MSDDRAMRLEIMRLCDVIQQADKTKAEATEELKRLILRIKNHDDAERQEEGSNG